MSSNEKAEGASPDKAEEIIEVTAEKPAASSVTPEKHGDDRPDLILTTPNALQKMVAPLDATIASSWDHPSSDNNTAAQYAVHIRAKN
ncbi:MAG: hypothetical protein SGARI_005790 [Bacillariaceae sp.]